MNALPRFRSRSPRPRQRGFSLLEMIVVLVIIGLIMGLVGPRLFGQADRAKVDTASAQVKMLRGALQTLRLDTGRFPSEEEGLRALVERPAEAEDARRWRGPYLDDSVPLDPWGNAYQYAPKPSGNQPLTLYSFGADGKRGGEDNDADIGHTPEA